MCGFTGYINLDSKQLDFSVLKKMTDIQSHRGPDDQGFIGFSIFDAPDGKPIENQENVNTNFHGGIGFNRLSILDLSLNGHQPMISNCGNYMIAYNGETYNALNFKSGLQAKGYQFRSNTDTEVILNLYIEHGIDRALELLNGMFAFAIVDLKKQKCFIVRDHFGIKPMYVYKKNETILFSSEVKSFTEHPDFKAEINTESLDEYLLFRYCAHDRSLYKDVKQIPPAHYYEISKENIQIKEYWRPDYANPDISANLEETLEKLDVTFKESIKSQLISDVKVGCQLSGGIDSSLVTTYAREFFDANMDTFSIVFSDEKYSEEQWINYVTNFTNSDSHRFQYTNQYAAKNLFSSTWHLDQPISIPNAIGIKRLAERSKENVTVLLSGEGADELFGGYSRYHDLSVRANNNINLLQKTPFLGKKFESKYAPSLSKEDFFILSSSALDTKTFSKFSPAGDLDKILSQRRDLFPSTTDLIKNASVYDMKTYMVDLLNRQDKMTMAHSVENRVPFLDREIVDFVMKTPSEFLVKKCSNLKDFNAANTYTKYILKKLAAKKFNSNFVYRKKSGFPLPIKDLYFNTSMKEQIEDLLMPGIKNRGVFDSKIVSSIWNKKEEHLTNADIKNLWMFFSFEVWAQIFIDSKYDG